jgi:glycosyltransferase involved in cell wall biosynthesis
MKVAKRSRRILLVTNHLGIAGAEKQLEHLAVGLAAAGHQVNLVAIGGRTADPARLETAGVGVVVIGAEGFRQKLRVLGALRRFARAAELVHCTGWDATLWGRLAAFLGGRPMIITEHTPGRAAQLSGTETAAGVRTIALHNRLLDRFTYATIAVGEWQRALLETEGVRPRSIVHIPNGVPIAELRARARQGPDRSALGVPADGMVVIQVARFAPQKGQATTLRTIDALRREHADIRLLFVGGGETEAAVRDEATAIGADWAEFLGYRDDVAGLLAAADLSVLPSDAEGLPMSLLEAAAVGTPMVATDVGDVGWFLDRTGAGIAVSRGDEEGFVAACARVLRDPDLRLRLAEAARRGAAEFDSSLMVERYERVFEAAIESEPLPADV